MKTGREIFAENFDKFMCKEMMSRSIPLSDIIDVLMCNICVQFEVKARSPEDLKDSYCALMADIVGCMDRQIAHWEENHDTETK